MGARLPGTDPRRVAALRAELDRVGSAVVPGWGAGVAPESFGRALLEIAARFAEETSSRLDRTAERDALAFFDTLDIPAPAPQAATATLVFVTEEARTTSTSAPSRVQVGTTVDDQEVIFETTRPLDVTPARIAEVLAVDPDADHIERAPGRVVATERPPDPVGSRRLVTAASAGSTIVQVTPATGLEPGDQVRIFGMANRIASVSQDLVTLDDPLVTAVPAGTPFGQIEALEAFTLRDLQQHVCYVGHSSLLNLQRPARIALELTPTGLAGRLAALDLRFELWGTKDGEDDAAWQALELVGGSATTLTLRKRWVGSVDELEIDGRKSRWLRMRHPQPITTVDVGADADGLRLTVRSEDTTATTSASGPSTVGSRTITNAFHNAAPLAVTGRFLPFGPTPARFDIFAFAASEALSKPGARVELDFRLADASLLALVAPLNAPQGPAGTLAYGIGADGLLHSVTMAPGTEVRWRALPTLLDEDGAPVVLDGAKGLFALRLAGGYLDVDLLSGQDRLGQFWYGVVLEGQYVGGSWRRAPAAGNVPLGDVVLAPEVGSGSPGVARLLRVHDGELTALTLGTSSEPEAAWETVAPSGAVHPKLDGRVAIAPVNATRQDGTTAGETRLVLAAEDGAVWLGRIGPVPGGLSVSWKRLSSAGARTDVRPAATLDPLANGLSQLWVAWADDDTGIAGWLGAPDGANGERRDAATGTFRVAEGSSLRVALQPWEPSATQPLTVAVARPGKGNRSVLVWFDRGSAATASLPTDAADQPPTDLVIVEPPAPPGLQRPLVVLPTTGAALVAASLDRLPDTALAYTLHDGLTIRGVADASHYVELIGNTGRRIASLSSPAEIVQGEDRVYEVAGGVTIGTSFQFLRRLATALQNVTGDVIDADRLRLHPSDNRTDTGRFVIVGSRTFEVVATDDTTEPNRRIVTVTPTFAAPIGSQVPYTPVSRHGNVGTVTAGDVQTLVHLSEVVDAGRTIRFDDGQPSLHPRRAATLVADRRWWRVAQGWTTVPTSGTAALLGPATIGSWILRALERGYDNPELSWEFFDGHGWRRLEQAFIDGTQDLAHSGRVSFRVPATLSATEIGGREDFWVRVRLVGGDYGRPKYVVTTTNQGSATSEQSTTIDTSELHPPEIVSIEASFVLDSATAPDSVKVVDNLATLDQTQASAADQARFALFSGVRAIDPAAAGRAVYVGLTRQPPNTLALYAVVDDQDLPGTLAVDVLTAAGWRQADVDDDTGGLHRTGLIQVFRPTPLARAACFGQECFWLRLRPAADAAGVRSDPWQPVVRGLFLNGVPAKHARTVLQEILGSSLGEPSLVLELAEIPVLPETLELRIREQLSEDERETLEQERRRTILISGRPQSEVPEVVETVPGVDGDWVLWRRVDSFIGSDGDARVYRLDPASGRITFGDGRQGKVPPAGGDAIRAFRYQQGGGRQGNASAWSDLAVKSALEGVEAMVLPVDAAGGVENAGPATLIETAPARLRHSGRALAIADYEALAAARPEVVRARCTSPERPGDPIRVVIAVRDGTRSPVPSIALRAAVARSLQSAGWGGLPSRRLRVDPPDYVAVTVTVRLRVRAALAAQVRQAATAALLRLFHPTDGGPGGGGWPFGRRVWESDVLRALEGIAGIDRVDDVDLARVDGRPLDAIPAAGLVWASEGDVDVQIDPVPEP